MSLINEALKRAKQAQAQQPASAGTEAPLQPAVHTGSGPTASTWVIGGVALLVLLVAGWFLSLWWRETHLIAQPAASPSSSQSTATAVPPPRTESPTPHSPTAVVRTDISKTVATEVSAMARPSVNATNETAVTPVRPDLSRTIALPSSPEPGSALTLQTNEVAAPQPTAVSPMPELKVQGIFYRGAKSSALINGQTLFLGDEVDGAKVIAIERKAVRLLWNGRTNTVKLH